MAKQKSTKRMLPKIINKDTGNIVYGREETEAVLKLRQYKNEYIECCDYKIRIISDIETDDGDIVTIEIEKTNV